MDKIRINKVLEELSSKRGLELAFVEEYYWEFSDYVAFSYNSREYIETGNIIHALVSNRPLIINKDKSDRILYEVTAEGSEHFQNSTLQFLIDNGYVRKI